MDIHGSCVSRDVFREQDEIAVKTYIGRNSIMSTQYPVVSTKFQDTSSKNSDWEKRMLDIDFSKSLFEELEKSHSEYLMIDLIDEIFELVKVVTDDGKESAVTNSQVLKKSDYRLLCKLDEVEVINTRNFPFSKIIDAIKDYVNKIIKIYGEDHIIINEAYPVERVIDKDGIIKCFDQKSRNNIKHNRYKLELYYALLEYEMPKAYVIKMPDSISADANHNLGIASTCFEQRFYENVYQHTVSYIMKNNVYESLRRDNIAEKSEEGCNGFDAGIIDKSNIVVWGTQIYFQKNIEKFKKKYPQVKYVYPAGPISDEIKKQYVVLESLEEIKKIDNCLVIIANGRIQDVAKTAELLRKHSLLHNHMDFYIQEKINIGYIKALKYYDYLDENRNHFLLEDNVSDKLVIRRLLCRNAKCTIGNNRISRRLFITLMGDSPCVEIGENSSFVDVVINVCSKGKVVIGNENMFSHSITLAQSDMHHIFDLKTGKRINYPKDINIGNHVWIGREVELLGGANIDDNCVVGARTVTSGKFPKNVIIAGCPGKIIRENIIWARDDFKIYDHDNYEQAIDKLGEKYIKKEEEK